MIKYSLVEGGLMSLITMKDVIREDHPVLRQVAEPFDLPLTDEDKALAKKMMEFLEASQDPELCQKYDLRPGIGLAAPQIAVPKQLIAVLVEDEKGREYRHTLFNPKIVSHSVEQTYLASGEGCLSVDREVPGYVPRYARITVTGINEKEEPVKLRLKGLPAIVFQHEIDHLNGILFFDRINKKDPFQAIENAVPIS